MPDGQLLEFTGVTKRFGDVTAVSDFSARVEPGVVTGFLGPNGAGKTTTLRILLGLVAASEGRATIGGTAYRDLASPLRAVGSVLEASSFHPGRTAAAHLKIFAQAAGLPASRVDEALGAVGLSEVAGRKVGGFSLGMRQRLGLAFALLGDPGVLVLDEPTNGLDPEGIIWMRTLLRELARQGRTVLVSSHLLGEVQQTADRLLIISGGRLVFQGETTELSEETDRSVVVDAPDRAALTAALTAAGIDFSALRGGLAVRGDDTAGIGRIALDAGVALSTLQRRGPSLEEVFLDLVNGVRVHPSAGGVVAAVVADAAAEAEAVEADLVDAEPAEAEPLETDVAADGGADDRADAVVAEDADAVAADVSAELDAMAASSPGSAAAVGFAVASTGIIEVIDTAPAAEAPDEESDDRPSDAAEGEHA